MNNNNGFWAIPKFIMAQKDLSFGAKATFGILWTRKNGDNLTWPSRAYIADCLGMGIGSVDKYLKELSDKKYIIRIRRGLMKSNAYKLTIFESESSTTQVSESSTTPTVRIHSKNNNITANAVIYKNQETIKYPENTEKNTEKNPEKNTENTENTKNPENTEYNSNSFLKAENPPIKRAKTPPYASVATHSAKQNIKLNPDFTEVMAFYYEQVQEIYGFKPIITAQDGKILKDILKKRPKNEVKDTIEWFLHQDCSRADRLGCSLSVALSSNIQNRAKQDNYGYR